MKNTAITQMAINETTSISLSSALQKAIIGELKDCRKQIMELPSTKVAPMVWIILVHIPEYDFLSDKEVFDLAYDFAINYLIKGGRA
jgi:hypothetical protein